MKKILIFLILMLPTVTLAQFKSAGQVIGIDTTGSSDMGWIYPPFLKEGTNINFYLRGDTLMIGGATVSGTADTTWFHNDADNDSIESNSDAIHLKWGNGIDATINSKWLTVLVDASELLLQSIGGELGVTQIDEVASAVDEDILTYESSSSNFEWHSSSELGFATEATIGDTADVLRAEMSDTADNHADLVRAEIRDTTVLVVSDTADVLRSEMSDTADNHADLVRSKIRDTVAVCDEQIEDIAGAMATGNTETGIIITYQDGDGTMDYELIYGRTLRLKDDSLLVDTAFAFTWTAIHTINANWVNTANPWADDEVSDNITVTGYMQDEDINTFAELQAWVSDKTLVNEEDIFTIDANWVNTANPWADNEIASSGNWNIAYDSVFDWDNRGYDPATTSLLGIASFVSTWFSVSGGAVSIIGDAIGATELDETENYTWTGAHDFGGVSAFKLPVDVTTDAEGEVTWLGTEKAIRIFDDTSRLITTYYDIDALFYAPSSINDAIPIFHVDADKYPNGIKLINVQITIPADGVYDMVFEEWAGDPPVAQNNIETVSTGASDSYMEVKDADIDDSDIDVDDYIFLDIPVTTVDWIHVKVIFWIK